MKYPGGQKQKVEKKVTYNNRGINLEEDINLSNEYYLVTNRAIIHKKPIPLQIANVDFKSRKEAVVKEAFFKTKSTTDYNGIYRSKHLDFEAKETKSTTSFPLSNIHTHQLVHMLKISEHGGISFIIVSFVKYQEYYLLPITVLNDFCERETRKSIPYQFFKDNLIIIKTKFNPRLDYLTAVDNIYF